MSRPLPPYSTTGNGRMRITAASFAPALLLALSTALMLSSHQGCSVVSAFIGVSSFPAAGRVLQNPAKRCRLSSLSMVPKKEKRRRQEDAKRRENLAELQRVQAQRSFVVQLQDLQKSGVSPKPAAVAARKLHRNVRHDGLNDIGPEARLSLLEIYYQANRTSDMVEHVVVAAAAPTASGAVAVAVANEEEDLRIRQYGLWAHSQLENWPSAVTFANQLFFPKDILDLSSETSAFSTPTKQLQLKLFAIQAYANTDRYLKRAVELFTKGVLEEADVNGMSRTDDSASAAILKDAANTILRSQIRNRTYQDVKTLYSKTLEKNPELLDRESHGLALYCAAQLGDISLMEQALVGLDEREHSQNIRVLETLAQASANGQKLSPLHQEMLKRIFGEVLQRNRVAIDAKTLSQILVVLDWDSAQGAVLHCCLCPPIMTQHNNNNNKGTTPWYAPLSIPAKVRVLPALIMFEKATVGNYTKGGDPWKLFSSLVRIDKKTGAVTKQSRGFLRNQKDVPFCYSSLVLADMEGKAELYQTILQECCETVFTMNLLEDEIFEMGVAYRTSLVDIVRKLPELPSESARIELFGNILTTVSSREHGKAGTLPSFASEKLTLIVQSTVRWLRVNANEFVSSSSNGDSENIKTERLRKLGINIGVVAIALVSGLEEFSIDHVRNYGTSDNGAKEALQTIMKELLLLNLLADDDELAQTACEYFFALAKVSPSSSVIKDKDLLFPYSMGTLKAAWTADPFQNFRSIVLQQEKNKGWSAKKLLIDLATAVLEDEGGDPELGSLLVSVIYMSLKSDERTGGYLYDTFVTTYENYFLKYRSDLFFDRELFSDLCFALEIQASIPVSTPIMVLSSDFASAIIDRLGSLRDANYWIVGRLQKVGNDRMLDESANYLVRLYEKAYSFDSIVSKEENSESLSEAYLNACGRNCVFLVKSILSGAYSLLKASRRNARSQIHVWSAALARMFQRISSAVADVEKSKDDEYIIHPALVDHVLNSFFNRIPDDDYTLTAMETLLSTESLHPEIRDQIIDWRDRTLPAAEVDDEVS